MLPSRIAQSLLHGEVLQDLSCNANQCFQLHCLLQQHAMLVDILKSCDALASRPGVQDTKRMRPGSGNNSRKGKVKGGKPRASVTLKELVDFGVILPGRNKISVSYKGINYLANLGKDGVIVYQGKAIDSG